MTIPFMLIFFSACSKRLDNRIAPVLVTVLGVLCLESLRMGMNLLNINAFLQTVALLILTVGTIFMNRVYRMKGWYPMALLSMVGLGSIPMLGLMIYQKIKKLQWGEWMPLEEEQVKQAAEERMA